MRADGAQEFLRRLEYAASSVPSAVRALAAPGGAIGTAAMIFLGFCVLTERTASRIVRPVAIPSSTMIAVLPAICVSFRSPR